jgi:hypothetical protein
LHPELKDPKLTNEPYILSKFQKMKNRFYIKNLFLTTAIFTAMLLCSINPTYAQGVVKITIDLAQPGPKINRHIFCHFTDFQKRLFQNQITCLMNYNFK